MSKSSNNGSTISFIGLLTVLFVGLKLGKVITWSWWWVLSPLWIPIALALVVLIIFGIFTLITSTSD